ncbi:MAG: hypothetical protein H6710_18780 [Myxococcales bacterium]|nr:hypothetical protein [Myxococcales bacterium]
MKLAAAISALVFALALAACGRNETAAPASASAASDAPAGGASAGDASAGDAGSTQANAGDPGGGEGEKALADVLSVSTTPSSWAVEVRSPDLGCQQYADWWEVVTPRGALIYRRILAHSHAEEQPFTRGGGPVAVGEEDEVIIRAHMNPGGYGGQALRGSVAGGFQPDPTIKADFAAALEKSGPQPDSCAF